MSLRVRCYFVAILPVAHTNFTVVLAIKTIVGNDANVIESLGPAFEKYNEEQFTTVKLPGGSQSVRRVSTH